MHALRSRSSGSAPIVSRRLRRRSLLLALLAGTFLTPGGAQDRRALVAQKVATDYPAIEALYRHFHAHPELSLMEEKTSARLAAELREAGYEVTEKFGGYGVVAVLKNGPGPTVLFRADMDALPVLEETGLPYASQVRTTDLAGQETAVMHACGHDIHMASLVGTARTLAGLREQWSGTLVLIGQPAEERVVGARAMLAAGLYRKFPTPDFVLGLHTSASLPAGTLGTLEGYAMANVDWVDITVRGVGGHGAYPHNTVDPIVLASRIVVAIQTIVSREIRPIEPAVVTVGTFHAGTKANIIPNEAKLQLTLRSYSDHVRSHLVEAIRRICRGEAIAAGLSENLFPVVTTIDGEAAAAVYNTPELTRRLHAAFVDWFGTERVVTVEPEMGGEDFSEYGRTVERVPSFFFRVGTVDPAQVAASQRGGPPLPSLHSSRYAPVPEPTLKAAVTASSAALLDLFGKP